MEYCRTTRGRATGRVNYLNIYYSVGLLKKVFTKASTLSTPNNRLQFTPCTTHSLLSRVVARVLHSLYSSTFVFVCQSFKCLSLEKS